MEKDTKDDRLYIRCTAQFKKDLGIVAASENRSLNNYVETVLQDKIEEYKINKKIKKEKYHE